MTFQKRKFSQKIWSILYGLHYYRLVLVKIYSEFISFFEQNQLFGEKSHLTENTTGLWYTEMSQFRSHRKWVIMTSFKPEMTQLDILVPFSVRIIQWGIRYYKEYYKWVIFSGWESLKSPLTSSYLTQMDCSRFKSVKMKYSPLPLIVTLKVYLGTFPLYSTTMSLKFKLMESQLSWRCGILLVRRSLIGWGHFPIQIRVSHSYELYFWLL